MGLILMAMLLLGSPQQPGTEPPQQPQRAAAPRQVSPSAAPAPSTAATPGATTAVPSEAGSGAKPMSAAEADATIDKLRQTVRESIENGHGPTREMDPEAQKALAEAADKFLSDPAIKGAIAEQIKEFKMPWQGSAALFGMLIPISFFAMIALIAAMFYWRSKARLRTRMEFHQQVLAKFTTGEQFAAFLNTPGSQQLLDGAAPISSNPKERMLKHARLGAIFSIMGLGLIALSFFDDKDYAFLGVIALGIGAGLLTSARLSYRLSERMGLLDRDAQQSAGSSATQL